MSAEAEVSGVLTPYDKRYWAASDQVTAYLKSLIPDDAKVLEIGPGAMMDRPSFGRSDIYVDAYEIDSVPRDKLYICNVAEEPLPFPDKSIDFVYCRHVLEDIYNPFFAMREMQRVAKAGYIETPSPIAELCRGVDVSGTSAMCHRGYFHHHFFIWVYLNQLRFLSKYSFLEYARIDDTGLMNWLREGPKYWNTYYLWKDEIKWDYRQNVAHFSLWRDMPKMLSNALGESRKASDEFWSNVPKEITIPQVLPQIGSKAAVAA